MPTLPDADSVVLSDVHILETLDLVSIFGNTHPIELDIGCGSGRFLIHHAETHPELNMLGIERMLGRTRTVAQKAIRRELTNIRLLRLEAGYAVSHMLPDASIRTAYLSFPDPWPKRRHHRRRLVQSPFAAAIHRILEPDGRLYLATDDEDYFAVMMAVFNGNPAFTEAAPFIPDNDNRSSFENLWLNQGKRIFRAGFRKLNG